MPTIERLLERFYARGPQYNLLAPVFAHMSPEHSKHLAAFVEEVMGGPKTYSEQVVSRRETQEAARHRP